MSESIPYQNDATRQQFMQVFLEWSVKHIHWVLIFFPFFFITPGEDIRWDQLLVEMGIPVVLIMAYQTSYRHLAPNYLANRNERQLLRNSLIALFIFTLILQCWIEIGRIYIAPPPIRVTSHWTMAKIQLLIWLRDMFFIAMTQLLATGLLLSTKWIVAENKHKEAEVALKEAELTNLRNQVSPHFLLNTLNNIYALTISTPERAQQAIIQLSKLLRHVLYENQTHSVDLQSEVDFIHNYVNLMKLRVSGYTTINENYHIPTTKSFRVAPMIFISLVENAFKHGIAPGEENKIDIYISADEEKITCQIDNTNHPKAQNDRSGHGIGLQQVEHRLKLAYPGRYLYETKLIENKIYSSKILIYDT